MRWSEIIRVTVLSVAAAALGAVLFAWGMDLLPSSVANPQHGQQKIVVPIL
jgi:hypothetical protein